MKRQPIFNQLMLQEVIQLSLHAAHANSQRTVFRINMPPSFLLWRIKSVIMEVDTPHNAEKRKQKKLYRKLLEKEEKKEYLHCLINLWKRVKTNLMRFLSNSSHTKYSSHYYKSNFSNSHEGLGLRGN